MMNWLDYKVKNARLFCKFSTFFFFLENLQIKSRVNCYLDTGSVEFVDTETHVLSNVSLLKVLFIFETFFLFLST